MCRKMASVHSRYCFPVILEGMTSQFSTIRVQSKKPTTCWLNQPMATAKTIIITRKRSLPRSSMQPLLVYYLRELEDEGRIPVLPVAVDTPMGTSATRLYLKHKEDHDSDMQQFDRNHINALATRNFNLVHGRDGSKALDAFRGPAVIISASGMATGGRVLHHLAQWLPDPASTVVFVGYQAAGTRGRRLVDGEKSIKIHGQMVDVRAAIERIDSLSAHADSTEIMRWLSGFKHPPRTTFVVHGEPDSAQALRDRIASTLGWN